MAISKDYLREAQKFATSQYLNSGIRITAGVMVPLLVLVQNSWLSVGIPFLWGALFVSLTDTPGPIHHRRNGMIAAILLNTIVVIITAFTREYQILLIIQIVVGGFILSMAGIYGSRAGAVGVLALVVMLLNLLSIREQPNTNLDSLLVCGGGVWYMVFSLMLYRLRPYRIVEQALGENLIAISDYIRARASFYKEGTNLEECFNRVMDAQSTVQKSQTQTQELLFKTRKFVADPSPKSRSSMMIYLDSLDLFEETMYSYHDYQILHKTLSHTNLLKRYYGVILQLAAELEHVGISVQRGIAVKRKIDFTKKLRALHDLIQSQYTDDADIMNALHTLEKTLLNIQYISKTINKLILYTRHEAKDPTPDEIEQNISKVAISQPVNVRLMLENLTLKSDTFRHAIRLTVAMSVAYVIGLVFSLSHTYWVLLTIVTIMKPLYSVTRERNISRVAGTLVGVLLVFIILYFITATPVLLIIMIGSMLAGYSLLRVNYFVFVIFITVFVIISFHFLNPLEFQTLIKERIIDTVIGSVIAFLASRFVFPVWVHEEIKESMRKMLEANYRYFNYSWKVLKGGGVNTTKYESARQDAVVALTNLSDNFQRMLAEPRQSGESQCIHQFVIASHMLTGHIAALSAENFSKDEGTLEQAEPMANAIKNELSLAEIHLKNKSQLSDATGSIPVIQPQHHTINQLSTIHTLAKEINRITKSLEN